MGHTHPTQDDSVVAALSEVVGGPVGRRAARGTRWFTPLAFLLVLTACTVALGVVSKTSCAEQQWRTDLRYAHNDEPDLTRYTHACDSQIATAYADQGFAELAWPWSLDEDTRDRWVVTDDPALVGLWSAAAARVTHLLAGRPDLSERYRQPASALREDPDVRKERVIFVGVNAVGLAALALLSTAALSRLHRRRPFDAAGFAASPVLALGVLVSWDLIAVAAVAGAVWAWSRQRIVLAGLLVGVGAAAGIWPVVLLLAFGLVAARAGRAYDVVPAAVTALGAWALLNAPAFLSGREPWERFFTAGIDRGADHGSIWTVLRGLDLASGDAVTVLSWTLLGAWTAGVIALAMLSRVPPRVEQVAFLLVAGVLMLKLAYDPQLALWLLPLAVVARPRWRDLLVWQAGEVLFFAMHYWWLGGLLAPGGDGQAGFYFIAIAVRLLCTGWLVAMVVRDVWVPELDPVAEERDFDRSGTTVLVAGVKR